jgi:glycosyltransferase involved in cell wall biosynthesis
VRVQLLVTKKNISKQRLSEYFNVELANVELQNIHPREVKRSLARADLSVVIFNFRLFDFPSKRNVFVIQIPYPRLTLANIVNRLLKGEFVEAIKDPYRRYVLSSLRRSDRILVYSKFVQDVLKEYHDVSAEVLYPPIDDFRTGGTKENVVLSVGRFFSGLFNDKRHDVLIEAFKRLSDQLGDHRWRYHLVGSCTEDRESQAYLASLREAANGYPIHFYVNMPYEELKRQYNRATFFWHAAGFGIDEAVAPDSTEHFGMTTVEAMSAECIPIVIDKGGQKEIVRHGVNGFLWNSTDELVRMTADVMQHKGEMEALRREARRRYADFSREKFDAGVATMLLPMLAQ